MVWGGFRGHCHWNSPPPPIAGNPETVPVRPAEGYCPLKSITPFTVRSYHFFFFVLVAVIGVVRSCTHVFSPDGSAGSIAGRNLNISGANEVIFAFALWGSEQLVYASIQWLVILRYRSLVPLMWGVQFLETLGRMLVGQLKPVTFANTPPGSVQNYGYLGLALLMLALSLWSSYKDEKQNK